MPTNEITKLYKGVIDDVIRNVRKDFVNMGVDEQVLYDLQMLWEQKLMDYKVITPGEYYGTGNATGNLLIQSNLAGEHQHQPQGGLNALASGAASMPVPGVGVGPVGVGYQQNYHSEVYGGYIPNGMRPPTTGHVGNNTYYHPTQGYFEAIPAPTAANLPNFHQISQLQQQQQQLLQQQQQQRLQRPPLQQVPVQQKQQPQPQPTSQPSQAQKLQQKDSGKQSQGPAGRYDGASDDPSRDTTSNKASSSTVNETDMTNLNDPDEIIRLLFSSKREKEKQQQNRTEVEGEGETDLSGRPTFNLNVDLGVKTIDDDEINSDLDDDDEDDEEGRIEGEGDEENGGSGGSGSFDENIVLCQYEKVNRTRNKWRCFFKSGIIHLNGIDFAFSKANGEFEW